MKKNKIQLIDFPVTPEWRLKQIKEQAAFWPSGVTPELLGKDYEEVKKD